MLKISSQAVNSYVNILVYGRTNDSSAIEMIIRPQVGPSPTKTYSERSACDYHRILLSLSLSFTTDTLGYYLTRMFVSLLMGGPVKRLELSDSYFEVYICPVLEIRIPVKVSPGRGILHPPFTTRNNKN